MEKEAKFMINPEVDIFLKHPVLKNKVITILTYLKKNYKVAKSMSPSVAIAIAKMRKQGVSQQKIDQFFEKAKQEAKFSGYQFLIDEFGIGDEVKPSNFEDYINKRIMSRRNDGIEIVAKPDIYLLNQIAQHKALEQTKIEELPCTCQNKGNLPKASMMQILPTADNDDKCIIYNSCLRTLFAAFKRQLKATPRPDKNEIKKFINFAKKFIDTYVDPHINEFDYSYSQWFNHLNRNKQDNMIRAAEAYKTTGAPRVIEFGLFCKREVQQDGGKNRAIANIQDMIKYIMGPVCWGLEAMFTDIFPGYCGNKSGEDLENYLTASYKDGFTIALQGDGSGFDLSQHTECKEIDRYIYKKILHKVHHVAQSDFDRITQINVRQLKAALYVEGRKLSPFSANVPGTVFSGSSDTTLMNTIRMALYNHYTMYKARIPIEQYKLTAKGDDFMILIGDYKIIPQIKKAYNELWASKPKDMTDPKQNYQRKGIGQIIKFLKIGDFSTLDFCSNAFIPYRENGIQKFKVMRRPERMIELAHYSRKLLNYTPQQVKTYYLDLALALEVCCGKDIPFYRNYIEAYRYWASLIPGNMRSIKNGRKKICMRDDGHVNIFKLHQYDPKLEYFYQTYGNDFYYSVAGRLSSNKIPPEYVSRFLLDNYHLTDQMIERHREILKNALYRYNPISEFICRD
jgi:hypothetical protein